MECWIDGVLDGWGASVSCRIYKERFIARLIMTRQFTLEYWMDDGWYVGRLKEIPSVFSQGETLQELEENIREAYQLMKADGEMTNR